MKKTLAALLSLSFASACAEPPLPVKTAKDDAPPAVTAAPAPDREPLYDLVRRIIAADYAGDRPALDRLYTETDRFLGDKPVEAQVRYWKGFTKWRRAMNGANETPMPEDLADDAVTCAEELHRAGEADPTFIDARIGEMQCLGLVLFFERSREGNDQRIPRLKALFGELKESAAHNPRYTWAWGMAFFGLPPERGGGPKNVIEAYLKALDELRQNPPKPASPLFPSWGEAELCVNLAYSYLNQPSPDLALAKKYVDEAVRLVPIWHYAKDILRPQIEAAAQKAANGSGATP